MLKALWRWVAMDLTWHKFPQFWAFSLRAGLWAQMSRGRTGFSQDGFLRAESMVSGLAGEVLGHYCSRWTPGNFPGAWNLKLYFSREGWGSRSLRTMLLKWKPPGSILLWCSSGNSVELKAYTIYKPQLHISGLERDTKSFYIFILQLFKMSAWLHISLNGKHA